MAEHRTLKPNEDPVCGMTVNIEEARRTGLSQQYDGREYVFCGKGCFLEFRDDAESFLRPDYVAEM